MKELRDFLHDPSFFPVDGIIHIRIIVYDFYHLHFPFLSRAAVFASPRGGAESNEGISPLSVDAPARVDYVTDSRSSFNLLVKNLDTTDTSAA